MNVTLSIDDRLVRRARKYAEAQGKSLNQLMRDHLQAITAEDDADGWIGEFRRLSKRSGGDSRGWRFDRDEIHARG